MDTPIVERVPYISPEGLFKQWQTRPYTTWLDSCSQVRAGRYSFMMTSPFLSIRVKGNSVLEGSTCLEVADPFAYLQEVYDRFFPNWEQVSATLWDEQNWPPFLGGMVGYLGYDLRHFVEVLPANASDDLSLPDAVFGFYDIAVAWDWDTKTTYLISNGAGNDGESSTARAQSRRDWLKSELKLAGSSSCLSLPQPEGKRKEPWDLLKGHFSRESYADAIRQVKKHISCGDIYQANLAQRFEFQLQDTPWELYERLRTVNPAPFSVYMNCEDHFVASSSPERFLKLSGDYVETCPIKGTRPRSDNQAMDLAYRAELLSSEKDKAENVMIVDLHRNDLGRFCRYGSIKVPELLTIEGHPRVWHLVSTVNGRVLPSTRRFESVKLCFPGGSITGAPKIRAMEIIDELEPVSRGIYTGAIGYFGWGGQVDLNIAIRTFVIKDQRAFFHVGGGIVADSDPYAEYDETLDKAAGLVAALELEV